MIEDPLCFLQNIITKDFQSEPHRNQESTNDRLPLIITLARDYGALGEEIAHQLSRILAIPCYDQEIQDLLAERAKVDKFEIARFDEQDPDVMSAFLYSLLKGSVASMENYRRYLREVLDDLSANDCLIIGRGAHLMLRSKRIFRLRIVGSRLVCANRIAQEENIAVLEAGYKVFDINNKRHKSIDAMFKDSHINCALEQAKNFDLILNTDYISAEAAIPIILLAIKQFGFDLNLSDRISV